jgi:FemAB-related protein (PEP-CTERM system-associated)
MRVEREEAPGAEWDEFAEATPGACLGHAAAWAAVLREAYRLEPCYLVARRDSGALAGLLPLVRFRTLTGARELVSLPFLDAAGILAPDPDAFDSLRQEGLALARSEGARALELRQPHPTADSAGFPAVDRVNLVLPLAADAETQWKALRAKVRNQTRKAEREGLEIAAGAPGELFDDFYAPFRANMRDLGSPVHAAAFFRAAARHFGDRLRFVVTRLGRRPVGGLVAIRYGRAVTVPWASTLRSERSRCPNNLIYWEALRWAIERGAAELDFGRSERGGGTHRFKLGWGALEQPLGWVRLGPGGEPLPMALAGSGTTLARLSSLWTRLPLPVASALGPRLRRYFSN